MTLNDIDLSNYDNTLFLDRDGVINRLCQNDYIKCWEEFEFLPGVFDAIAKWNKQFKYIIIFTNQRGIGKEIMTEESLRAIHSNMLTEIVKHGGRIDKIYYCTALTDSDPNRKPNIGMFLEAQIDFPDINLSRSVMIGDSECDMKFAENVGIRGIYLK